MERFIRSFERQPDGSWRCISFADISTVSGRIQVTEGSVFTPGTIFMGVDICNCLDEEADRLRGAEPHR